MTNTNKNPCLYHLSNGISVVLDNVDSSLCNIAVSLGLKATNEKQQEYGIVHFIEHILGQGTTKNDSFSAINKQVELLGGILNIRTTHDDVCFLGAVLSENLDGLLNIISDDLRLSLFDEVVIENEKNIILDEYRRYVYANSWPSFKSEKLFNAHPILGTPESIQSFSKQQLLNYYQQHLSANNMQIIVSGKINDTEHLINILEHLFNWIPNQTPFDNVLTDSKPVFAHNLISNSLNEKITLAFQDTVKPVVDNRQQKVAMGVFRKILQNRLMQSVRDKGLSYSIQCSKIGIADKKFYTINSETLPENLEHLVITIAETCTKLISSETVTPEELIAAKMVVKFQNAQIIDSPEKRCSTQLAFFRQYKALYDFSSESVLLDSLSCHDINQAGHTFFARPVSILTQGPAFDSDLPVLWDNNFSCD